MLNTCKNQEILAYMKIILNSVKSTSVCVSVLDQSHLTLCDSKGSSLVTPLSMGFFRQEYWSALLFLLQGIFPTQGLNVYLLCLLHWQVDSLASGFFTTVPPGKPLTPYSKVQTLYLVENCFRTNLILLFTKTKVMSDDCLQVCFSSALYWSLR